MNHTIAAGKEREKEKEKENHGTEGANASSSVIVNEKYETVIVKKIVTAQRIIVIPSVPRPNGTVIETAE
jgi:hypothetical protein